MPGPGYYLITDEIDKTGSNPDLHGAVSAYMLQVVGVNTSLELNSKTDVPSLNKVIDKDGGVAANSVSIGDTVPFKLTSKVPDMSRYNRYWFKVTDTLCAGFDFNNDVEIKIGDNTLTAGDDYTVSATGKMMISSSHIPQSSIKMQTGPRPVMTTKQDLRSPTTRITHMTVIIPITMTLPERHLR